VAQPPFEVNKGIETENWKIHEDRREDSRTDAIVFLLLAKEIAIKSILTNATS
jgi:hypothetical protein